MSEKPSPQSEGPGSLPLLRNAIAASDAAEVKKRADRIDWANREGRTSIERFWTNLPLSMLPRSRSLSEQADMACVDALAQAPGFLAAFAEAIEALGLPATSLFSTDPMASLTLRAVKAMPEWAARRAVADIARVVMEHRVRPQELELFGSHGFDLGAIWSRREKIQALDSWRARGAGPAQSKSSKDFTSRLAAATQSLRWLEERRWVCPEDYPEQLDRAADNGLRKKGDLTGIQGTVMASEEAILTRALMEWMGKGVFEHPHWPAWARGMALRGSSEKACEEWRMVAAWIQSLDLAADVAAMAAPGEEATLKRPPLRV